MNPFRFIDSKNSVARIQVNIRLSVDHTQKYLEIIEYYQSKEGITFLEEEMSSSELESNSTALGRFLLETAIDDAYMELKDQKVIETIAGWIGFEQYEWSQPTVRALGRNPAQHKRENSSEWQSFCKADGGRIENDYISRAFLEWDEDIGDTYYTQFFDRALILAIQNYNAQDKSPVNEDRELERRMKRWKRNG